MTGMVSAIPAGWSGSTIAIVIPVYRGETTLRTVVDELLAYSVPRRTPAGRAYLVSEILLVDDNGPDASAEVIAALEAEHPGLVEPVWLSRNYGQHAATLAGMAASAADWVVTMDEDGQHDPAAIGAFLDAALDDGAQVVYGRPTNEPPYSRFRNLASNAAKWMLRRWLAPGMNPTFQSFRLIEGEIAHATADTASHGIFLDVALAWVTRPALHVGFELRGELRSSGYSTRRLVAHFWHLVLSSGTRALRTVGAIGIGFSGVALVLGIVIVIGRLSGAITAAGWTSLIVVTLLCTGLVLLALSLIAEYLGVVLNATFGRPTYLRLSRASRAVARPGGAAADQAPSSDSR